MRGVRETVAELWNVNNAFRERTRFALEALGDIISNYDAIQEKLNFANRFLMGEGDFSGASVKKNFTSFNTVSDAVFSKQVVIESVGVTFNGCRFVDSGDASQVSSLVLLGEEAKVRFINCEFVRKYNANLAGADNGMLVLTVGAKASVQSCLFRSDLESGVMNAAGNAINNLGVAADCMANGNVNVSTHGFVNTVTDGNIT